VHSWIDIFKCIAEFVVANICSKAFGSIVIICVRSHITASDCRTYRPASEPYLVFLRTSDGSLQKTFVLDGRGRLRLDVVKQVFGVTAALEIIISEFSWLNSSYLLSQSHPSFRGCKSFSTPFLDRML